VTAVNPGVAALTFEYGPIAWYEIPQETWVDEYGYTRYSLNRSTDFSLSRDDMYQYFTTPSTPWAWASSSSMSRAKKN
jgi:hypothetical protein